MINHSFRILDTNNNHCDAAFNAHVDLWIAGAEGVFTCKTSYSCSHSNLMLYDVNGIATAPNSLKNNTKPNVYQIQSVFNLHTNVGIHKFLFSFCVAL